VYVFVLIIGLSFSDLVNLAVVKSTTENVNSFPSLYAVSFDISVFSGPLKYEM